MKKQILTIASLTLLLSVNAFAYNLENIFVVKNKQEPIYKTFYKGIANGPAGTEGYNHAEFVESTPVNPNVKLDMNGANPDLEAGFKIPWDVVVHVTDSATGATEDYTCTDKLVIKDGKIVQNAASLLSGIWQQSYLHGSNVLELDVSKSSNNTVSLIYMNGGAAYGLIIPAKTSDGSMPNCQLS